MISRCVFNGVLIYSKVISRQYKQENYTPQPIKSNVGGSFEGGGRERRGSEIRNHVLPITTELVSIIYCKLFPLLILEIKYILI
jgi:hypothetical protein